MYVGIHICTQSNIQVTPRGNKQTIKRSNGNATSQQRQQANHHPIHHVDGLSLININCIKMMPTDVLADANKMSENISFVVDTLTPKIFRCHLASSQSPSPPIKNQATQSQLRYISILSLLSVSSFCKWCSIDMFGLMP